MEPSVQLGTDERQFWAALNDISLSLSIQLKTPSDRVRIAEWIRKLCGSPHSSCNHENWSKTKNEYAQYLRIMTKSSPLLLASPFTRSPPENDLPPLSEMLGNLVQQSLMKFPKTGPIKPVVCHTCAEGKAFMTVQRCQQSGAVYCYMAVAPDALQMQSQAEQENT